MILRFIMAEVCVKKTSLHAIGISSSNKESTENYPAHFDQSEMGIDFEYNKHC